MTKFTSLFLALSLGLNLALEAHEVWIEDLPTGQLVVRFAEYGEDYETSPGHLDELSLPESWKVEAEGVAYLLCSILDLPGREESRGYIQHWFQGDKLPEKAAQRIFKVSQQILAAGRPPAEQP